MPRVLRNPFDSDDESDEAPANFAAGNPFDDAVPRPQSRVAAPKNVKHNAVSDSRNPFDDDSDDYDARRGPSSRPQRAHSQEKSFFDEDDSVHRLSRPDEVKEKAHVRFRDRISGSGEFVMKRAQKIKDAGSSGASNIVDGGITQVSKVKESGPNVLRPKTTHTGAKKTSVGIRNGPGDDLRADLFDGPMKPKPTLQHYDDSQFRQQELENKSIEELEGYAMQKAEQTTSTVDNCIRIAEDMKDKATVTLVSLNEQRDQIRRTHELTLEIDNDLSTGEKLLGSLGGMFSKTWKPKKGRPVTGPALAKNDSFKRRGHHLEQRVALGLNKSNSRGRNNRINPSSHMQQTTQEKLELEKAKQDDGLDTLSHLLDELSVMSKDMGAEIASQNVALDNLDVDVDSLGERVKGANRRTAWLLHK